MEEHLHKRGITSGREIAQLGQWRWGPDDLPPPDLAQVLELQRGRETQPRIESVRRGLGRLRLLKTYPFSACAPMERRGKQPSGMQQVDQIVRVEGDGRAGLEHGADPSERCGESLSLGIEGQTALAREREKTRARVKHGERAGGASDAVHFTASPC
jgi:hypothetical protein